ncbi:MAG: hypothetical protein U5L96_03150 [Owenweeksia sp.]|nr:hypothetical protein [Owenweeksia sp.]
MSGLTTPALYFMQHRFYTTSGPADMEVKVSNDAGTTWSNVYTVTGNIQSSSNDPWVMEFVNLGAYQGDTFSSVLCKPVWVVVVMPPLIQ